MNVEAIKRTRDLIAKQSSSYDQGMWGHECGTPACIAGFACVAHGDRLVLPLIGDMISISEEGDEHPVAWRARDLLDLDDFAATRLFNGHPFAGTENRTRALHQDAIATLDHLIETGEVVWTRGPDED